MPEIALSPAGLKMPDASRARSGRAVRSQIPDARRYEWKL